MAHDDDTTTTVCPECGSTHIDLDYDHHGMAECRNCLWQFLPVIVTDAQLQAAFLAAREHGAVLNDDVLRAIILAVQALKTPKAEITDPYRTVCPECEGAGEVRHPMWGSRSCPSPEITCPVCHGSGEVSLDTAHDWDDEHEAPEPTPYFWPSPDGDGFIDAWNGWYATADQAQDEGAYGVGSPRILQVGEGLITQEEADARREALGPEPF